MDSEKEAAHWAHLRLCMVREQIQARGVASTRVLEVIADVPRHAFVSPETLDEAYADHPLPIGFGQTISQPYIIALTAEAARVQPTDNVLEIGGGCGYQAAILSQLGRSVCSMEIVEELAKAARARLKALGYSVHVVHGDGTGGYPERAPFNVIVVAAAARKVPDALIEQLAVGGRLVIPLGDHEQTLVLFEKTVDGVKQTLITAVRFVPLITNA